MEYQGNYQNNYQGNYYQSSGFINNIVEKINRDKSILFMGILVLIIIIVITYIWMMILPHENFTNATQGYAILREDGKIRTITQVNKGINIFLLGLQESKRFNGIKVCERTANAIIVPDKNGEKAHVVANIRIPQNDEIIVAPHEWLARNKIGTKC